MNNNIEGIEYQNTYQDFLHPNPNIYSKAILLLIKNYPKKFMENILYNLEDNDLLLRRKSILALGEFGEVSFNPIFKLYLSSNSKTLKTSCLKSIIKVIVKYNLQELTPDIMSIIDMAIKDDSQEIILTAISLLRQLGINGKRILMKTSRDKNLLRAKASVTALLEMKDNDVNNLLYELYND